MSEQQRNLCIVYAVIAFAALIGTWSNNLAFFALPDNGGLLGFIRAGSANPAAASLSTDLGFLCVACVIWMWHEARRLGIAYVWAYIVLSFLVAISVTFPLFLIAREMRLAAAPREGRRG